MEVVSWFGVDEALRDRPILHRIARGCLLPWYEETTALYAELAGPIKSSWNLDDGAKLQCHILAARRQ